MKTQPHIAAAINRFERAVNDYAFIGAQPPEDRAAIEKERALSRSLLVETINRLSAPTVGETDL
jgi:hypothetical protein